MTEERYIEIDSMNEEQAGTIEEAERLEYNRMNYIKETDQESAFEDLLAQIETAQQGYLNVWQTGFSLLDDNLDGGFLGGNLIILGAVSSLGKTTFALQIADQIASFGKDVLIFSLEMSKKELNAKSISRNTFKITDRGITKDKYPVRDPRQKYRVTMGDVLRGRVGLRGEAKRELFEEALTMSRKQSEHIFIWRDNDVDLDKIADIIQLHKDIHNQSPFVIIDYLQILKARQESKTTDKRLLTDDDVNRLKDLAEEKDLPIMVISSFNRTNYIEPASMGSYKESGTIEYSADTLIALQYSGMAYKKFKCIPKGGKKEPYYKYESKIAHDNRVRSLIEKMDKDGAAGEFLPIDVVLLKNRGVSKGKVLFEFCPKFNIFREKTNQDTTPYDYGADIIEEDGDGDDSSGLDVNSLELPEIPKNSKISIGAVIH